jgi:hypothetical protein
MSLGRLAFCLVGLAALRACLGAEFANLNFDEADTSGILHEGAYYGVGKASGLLPGWSLYEGTNLFGGLIFVNPASTVPDNDGIFVALYSREDTGGPNAFPDGVFALSLGRARTNSPVLRLEQTAAIPVGTQFMAYKTTVYGLEIDINNHLVPPLNAESPPGYGFGGRTNLIYDVSKFAGQETKLSFVGPFGSIDPFFPDEINAYVRIDSIRFVTAPPSLDIARSGNQVTVSWPASTRGLVLQMRQVFAPATNIWIDVPKEPIVNGDRQEVSLSTTNAATTVFQLGLSCDWCF